MQAHSLRLIMRHFILPVLLLAGFGIPAYSLAAGPSCEAVFTQSSRNISKRLKIIETPRTFKVSELVSQLRKDKKLVYEGNHKYESGTEFLASNEFDWLATPFDHKPADVMIAFGTNSAWEIATNKNVKSLYLADWSPYPLLASAYLISPLMKMAHTPNDFVVLLSGRIPTPENTKGPLEQTFLESTRYASSLKVDKISEVKQFLRHLAKTPSISEFELRFLTSYYYGLAGVNAGKNHLGPFANLRYANYAKIISFFDQRYSPDIVADHNRNVVPTVTLPQASVFSSQSNFNKLRNLFVSDQVQYGLTSITDMKFYQAIKAKEGPKRYTLSITNIFDCGEYNGLTQVDFQNFLRNTMKTFEASPQKPLVIFQTTNTQPPHGFLRHDLTGSH